MSSVSSGLLQQTGPLRMGGLKDTGTKMVHLNINTCKINSNRALKYKHEPWGESTPASQCNYWKESMHEFVTLCLFKGLKCICCLQRRRWTMCETDCHPQQVTAWATAFTHGSDVLHFWPTRREYLIPLPSKKKRSDMKRSPMVFRIILSS